MVGGFSDVDRIRFESQDTANADTGEGCDFAASATRFSDSEYVWTLLWSASV
jgi:hypothetical protein